MASDEFKHESLQDLKRRGSTQRPSRSGYDRKPRPESGLSAAGPASNIWAAPRFWACDASRFGHDRRWPQLGGVDHGVLLPSLLAGRCLESVQKLHRVERKVCTDYPQAYGSDGGRNALRPANWALPLSRW